MTLRVKARFGGPFLSVLALAAVFSAAAVPVCAAVQAKKEAPVKGSANGQASAEALDRMSAFFKDRAAAHGIVGASLRVVGDKGALRQAAFGLKDRATGTPVDEATIFHWASITKTLTGIAILQLRDRGRLTLDDPILKYVHELAAVRNAFGPMSAITIRQLLSHTAGFRAGTWPFGGDKPWHPFEPTEWSQLVAMMPYTEVELPPGTKYSYSNPGLVYLGRVVESLAGESWEQYVTKNVLMPLGMTRTFFDHAPYHLVKDRSHSYIATKGRVDEAPFDFDSGITVSNGGLNAPLGDMEKYLRFLMGHAETDAGAAVLSRKSLDEMWTPVALVEAPGSDRVDMGLCFFIEQRAGRKLIGHSGSQNGFISHLYIDPAADAAYVVSFNTEAAEEGDGPNTRGVDAALRTFFVTHVAPVLEAAKRAAPVARKD